MLNCDVTNHSIFAVVKIPFLVARRDGESRPVIVAAVVVTLGFADWCGGAVSVLFLQLYQIKYQFTETEDVALFGPYSIARSRKKPLVENPQPTFGVSNVMVLP